MVASKTFQQSQSSSYPIQLRIIFAVLSIWLCLPLSTVAAPITHSNPFRAGNPVIYGWYADPNTRIFGNEYWIYPTTSADPERKASFDAFSSKDLITWKHHPHVLDFANIPWSTNHAAWAPTVAGKNGKFYMYFSAGEWVSIGVAESDSPAGPFKDVLGKPLIEGRFFEAWDIDAAIFIDDDGRNSLYYGASKRCVVVELGDDMVTTKGKFIEITPPHYTEAPFMVKRDGGVLPHVQLWAVSTGSLLAILSPAMKYSMADSHSPVMFWLITES